jgi:hypothetical protein
MEQGLVLPANHGVTEDDVDHIWDTTAAYLAREGI